ncbi:hypothetical protein H5T51_01535 [Candidatus Bathyarchaeota archaeon]|nr:hypothetical protein [Candidatus Bathyarchaeota archaeon]
MGRKMIANPLEEGLVCRIYLAAFPRPRSSYEIAKMVVRGGSAQNSSGRVLKVAEKFSNYFSVMEERVSKHKARTLILSNAQPFFSRLIEECQLNAEEAELLKELEQDFRRIMDVYLNLTLNRNPKYLTSDLNAFQELSTALALTLYIARSYAYAHPQAGKFSLSMMSTTLPTVLEAAGVANEEILNIAKSITNIAQQQISNLYTKIKRAISSQYETLFIILEGFEKYYQTFEKNITSPKNNSAHKCV